MTILEWTNFAINVLACVLFAAGVVVGLLYYRRERNGADEAELKRLVEVRELLQGLLRGTVSGFIKKAEQEYGSGQGVIKKSAVVADLIQVLPRELQTLFDVEELGNLVENTLKLLKEEKKIK